MTSTTKSTEIPTALICDPWATAGDVRVYSGYAATAHVSYPGQPAHTYVTTAELAVLLGISLPQVKRSTAKLVKAGWISRERTEGGTRPANTVLNPAGR